MKLRRFLRFCRLHTSPPSRGAWIEISAKRAMKYSSGVAPLAGGVD